MEVTKKAFGAQTQKAVSYSSSLACNGRKVFFLIAVTDNDVIFFPSSLPSLNRLVVYFLFLLSPNTVYNICWVFCPRFGAVSNGVKNLFFSPPFLFPKGDSAGDA